MSFAAKVAALRKFFVIPDSVELPTAVQSIDLIASQQSRVRLLQHHLLVSFCVV